MAVHAVGIITTEGMTEAMTTETTIAGRIEGVAGEPPRRERRSIEDARLRPTIVAADTDRAPGRAPTPLAATDGCRRTFWKRPDAGLWFVDDPFSLSPV